MPNDDNDNPWGGGNNSGNKSPWGNSNGSGGKGPRDDKPTSVSYTHLTLPTTPYV